MTIKIKLQMISPDGKKGRIEEYPKGTAQRLVKGGHAEYIDEPEKKATKKKTPPKKSPATIEPKDILKQELNEQTYEEIIENEINWLDDEFYNSWDKVKGRWHNLIKPNSKEEYELDQTPKVDKWFFLAHENDEIIGKPQLVENVMKRIPLVRLTAQIKTAKKEEGETEARKYKVPRYLFFDERYDKRYDGAMLDCFSCDFWTYKIVTPDGKEVFIWTKEKLPNCACNFKGMMVELDDFAELSRSLKIKSISKIFFLKSFEPDVKILPREEIVKFTQSKEINEAEWDFFLSYHRTGNINLFDDDVFLMRSAFLLSGKFDGYPLHLGIMGRAGTKKSWGHLGTLDYKFSESSNIIGGGNTRAKALVPSFKEKPADVGYFARTERVGFIDEVCKMAELELNKHQTNIQNLFGEWNDLLDNVKRTVGSGNNNTCEVEATSKNLLVTNPLSNKPTIQSHCGVLDASMMSRFLWFVQDDYETAFLRSPQSILRISPHTSLSPFKEPESSPHTYTRILRVVGVIENRKKDIVLGKCWGKVSRSEFLTLFDSCNAFVCDIDQNEVQRLVRGTQANAKEPMKSSVWLPRAEHHITLLIDGLIKHRCLFKDYDPTFAPKEEDYDNVERILTRMIKSWDTDLSPKQQCSGGYP